VASPRPLPHSKPGDIAVNREARVRGGQLAALVYAGVWRIVLGLPAAAGGVALAWAAPTSAGRGGPFLALFFFGVALGLLGLGAYVSWRGFSFLGDAITRKVAYVTGRIDGDTKTYRGATTYYMVVGPSKTRVSRKTYKAMPMGRLCHAYYAPGSLHLFSIEPATETEPHPALSFGGDAEHAWDRLRWKWLVGAVAVFGLAAGANGVVSAHSAKTAIVSGSIGTYEEITGKSTSRYLYLVGDQTQYSLNQLDSFPQLYAYTGEHVDLYFNTDSGTDVLALRVRETLYASDLYRNPDHEYWSMAGSGIAIILLSALTLAAIVWWIYWSRKHQLGDAAATSTNVSQTTPVKM
jgi:hypothetical protein